jgi:hypothetical protein
MKQQLRNFIIWLAIVLLLLAIFTFFQTPGPRPTPMPPPALPVPPQDVTHWLLSLLISWLPFLFLVGMWIVLARWMRTGGIFGFGTAGAPSARMLADPAHWRLRAGEARATAERLGDAPSRQRLLEIAGSYEYLAERAEERRRASGSLS